jgi:hypothetical protein
MMRFLGNFLRKECCSFFHHHIVFCLTLAKHKSIHFSTAISYCRNRCNPSKRENRQNGNQESSQETSREESRQEGSEEKVTADPTERQQIKGTLPASPWCVCGIFPEQDRIEDCIRIDHPALSA